MTPQITILALAVIAAALSVIAALQRVYINKLKTDATYALYKAEKQTEHYEELLTKARNEAKTEYDLRRQAEKNLADANDELAFMCEEREKTTTAMTALLSNELEKNKQIQQLTQTCDDLFDTLCKAVENMPVPFHLRKRDENGRFVKVSAFEVAMSLHGEMAEANRKRVRDKAVKTVSDATAKTHAQEASEALDKFSTLVSETTRPKPHTLIHGLTVRKLCDEVKDNAGIGI